MTSLARRRLFVGKQQVTHTFLPWVIDAETFYNQCERCALCIEACETHIIKKGDGGFPQVDFSEGECTFCYQCAAVCPQDIFTAQNTSPWQQVAAIDDTCLNVQKVACRSCEDNCEPMAISFKATIGNVAQPSIDTDLCNGCGACIKPCPTSSIKIIPGELDGN